MNKLQFAYLNLLWGRSHDQVKAKLQYELRMLVQHSALPF